MQPMSDTISEPLIDLQAIEKIYQTPSGPVPALRSIDLRVRRSEFVGVVGPSGSGKSTLLNILAGIDRPTAGTLIIDRVAVHELTEAEASNWRGRSVGIVFQFFQLLPTLTALENVMLPMDFRGRLKPPERRAWATALLERVGVEDQAQKLPETLSGGQRQRVAIARALANDPPILLADEPTGNLDSQTSLSVLALFSELVSEGRTVVMVSHERDISDIATRTLTLVDGEIRNG
jgi:putative ABC transport system ATP-binding protein